MANPTAPYQSESTHGRSINWGWLVIGILFVVTAVLAFINPAGSLEAIAYAFAFMAIINGVWRLFSNMGSGLRIVGGILNILVGVFIIANIFAAMVALPYIFAIWFIVDSLFRLITVGAVRMFGAGYFWLSLVMDVLGIVIGVFLLLNPLTAALTLSFLVGFYLMMAGIEYIALAFAH